jgi:hypothetical protein
VIIVTGTIQQCVVNAVLNVQLSDMTGKIHVTESIVEMRELEAACACYDTRVYPKVSGLSHNEIYAYNNEHSLRSNTTLGPTQPPIQWVPGALSLGVEAAGA